MKRILHPAAALVLGTALAACAGTSRDAPRVAGAAPAAASPADPLASLPSDPSVARYAGPFARDAAVLAFQRSAGPLLAASVLRLHEETGLQFVEGRAPRVSVVDAPDVPQQGRAELRLADGVRRPEIRVRAAALVSGEFRPQEHLPALVAEAGVLAASPERAPPDWVLGGLPVVFAGGVDRRAAELLLGGPEVRTSASTASATALAPLEPAFRVGALARIGVGERVFARFLDARLSGTGETAALREVGVGSGDFLEAAAATDADRTLERIVADPRFAPLAEVRRALSADDLPAAEAALARVPAAQSGEAADASSAAGGPAAWIGADLRLVRAEVSLLRGDTQAAVAALDELLARPDIVLRLRDARLFRALAALRTDDSAGRSRAAAFVRASLDDRRALGMLPDLGIEAQAVFDLASSEAAVRAKAAARAGRTGKPGGATYLRACLTDGDATVRAALVRSIGALGDRDAAGDLDAACADPDPKVRAAAVTALADVDPARAARRAAELASDADAEVRRAAAAVAARAATQPAVRPSSPEPLRLVQPKVVGASPPTGPRTAAPADATPASVPAKAGTAAATSRPVEPPASATPRSDPKPLSPVAPDPRTATPAQPTAPALKSEDTKPPAAPPSSAPGTNSAPPAVPAAAPPKPGTGAAPGASPPKPERDLPPPPPKRK